MGFVRFAAGIEGIVRGRGRVEMSLRTGQSDAVQYGKLAPPQHHHNTTTRVYFTISVTPGQQATQSSPGHNLDGMRDICRDLAAVGGNI